MAVLLDRGGRGGHFGVQVLDLALLGQQQIALAGQDLVDAIVLAAASNPDELADLGRIVDGFGRQLSDLCRRAVDDQLGNCLGVAGRDRRLQALLLLRGNQGGLWSDAAPEPWARQAPPASSRERR